MRQKGGQIGSPARSSAVCARAGLGQGAVERLYVDGLYKVGGKPGSLTAADVRLHAVATEGDADRRTPVAQFRHQIVAASVRKADVRNEDVKFLEIRGGAGLGDAV